MFQKDVKNIFLNQFQNEDTKNVYQRVFVKSHELENRLNKDIYDFNQDELELFIKDYLKPKTKQSARTYCNVLSSYIQWGIENECANKDINPLRRSQNYFYSFVGNQNNLYLSKNQIDFIVERLINAQDSFIIQALFNGVQGTQLYELTSLTIDDVYKAMNNDNTLTLTNRTTKKGNVEYKKRELKVDDKTIQLALVAHADEEYYKKNGEVDYADNIKDVVSLPKSKYILKPTATNKDAKVFTDNPVSYYTVYNRLEMVKSLSEFDEFSDDALTTKNIVRSGMIYEAKKMLDKGEELNRKNIEKICNKFGISYKWSLKDFLNEETVREVYS